MNSKKVTVVVLNWNHPDDTIECLKSFKGLNTKGIELSFLVVDNASTDDSFLKINNFINKNSLKIIRNDTNYGFAEGNNVGIRQALAHGADYVLVLNNDTIVSTDFLVSLIKAAEKHPSAGALSPKIYFAKNFEFHKERYKAKDLGKVIWYAGGVIDWKNIYGANFGVDEVDKGWAGDPQKTDFATGACVLLRRAALEEVGVFDKKYFLYLEDTDLSLRMKKKGWEILYVPESHIWHKIAQSSGIGSGLNDYFITRNRLIFGIKYASRRAKIALIKESFKLMLKGRKWQKIGARDYFLHRYGKGSWH